MEKLNIVMRLICLSKLGYICVLTKQIFVVLFFKPLRFY